MKSISDLHFLWKASYFVVVVAAADIKSNKQSISGLSDLTLLLHACRELALSNSLLLGASDSVRNVKERRSRG